MKILVDSKRNSLPNHQEPDLIARNAPAAIAVLHGLKNIWSALEIYLGDDFAQTEQDGDVGMPQTIIDVLRYISVELQLDEENPPIKLHLPSKIVDLSDEPNREEIGLFIDKLYGHRL